MKSFSRGARLALVAACAVGALGLAGCASKKTVVDPSFVKPEGVAAGKAQLVLWREQPTTIEIWNDLAPAGPDANDRLARAYAYGSSLPGRIHGAILDSTAASAYQILRRDSNGGLAALNDFLASAARRWVDRHWDLFTFTDDDTARARRFYVGRGVINGVVGAFSPLTNEARDSTRTLAAIAYTGPTGFASDGSPVPLDSLFLMRWNSVAGAVGYYVHVYQPSFNVITDQERIESGLPAAIAIGKTRDILLAYVPAPVPPTASVSIRMPTPNEVVPGVRIMTARQTNFGQEYRVRVAAVDAAGRMIAFTFGTKSLPFIGMLPDGTTPATGQYALYPFGAVLVVPSR